MQNTGHPRQQTLESRLIEALQVHPTIHPRDDRGISRQVDQCTRPVGRDDLTAPDLARGTRDSCRPSGVFQVLDVYMHFGLHVTQ